MKKKWIVLIPFLVAVVSCSTTQDRGDEELSLDMEGPADASAATPPAGPEKTAAPPVKTVSDADATSELNAAIKSQNDERIKSTAEELLKRVTDHPQALNALALVHLKKGRVEFAGYLLNKAIQKDSQQGAFHSNLGLVQVARKEPILAIKSFRRALELNPRDGIAGANIGALYVQNKDFGKAVLALEIAYKQGIRDAKTLTNYGAALAATGSAKQAKDMYAQALKENSSSRELMLNYAILLIEHLSQNNEGIEILNRLKFLGVPTESRERVSLLENKAKAGLK